MIQDAPFWTAVRQDPKYDKALRCLLARFALLTSPSAQTSPQGAAPDGTKPASSSSSKTVTPTVGRSGTSPETVSPAASSRYAVPPPLSAHEPFADLVPPPAAGATTSAAEGASQPPTTSTANKGKPQPLPKLPESTIRLLQHTMLFMTPIPTLRYTVPALSLSWASSCCVDGVTQRFVTFGTSKPANVPDHLRFKACVAGDTFFAALTDNGEVWVSGSVEGGGTTAANAPAATTNSSASQVPETMRGVCGKTLQICGHGSRLFGLTTSLTLRPISAVSAGTRSLIPYRLVQFINAGLGDDLFMVGVDGTIYKTTASARSTGTPRRIMTFSRICVSRVASGSGSIAVIDQAGQLYTMGRNKHGQIGTGAKQDSVRRPVLQAALAAHFFTMVAFGEKHCLALTCTGVVYGCGSNETGQLGLGESTREMLKFTKIALPSPCVGIAAGPAGSMFACADGKLYACGANECQQLGIPYGARALYVPTAVPGVRNGVVSYVVEPLPVRRGTSPVTSSQAQSFDSVTVVNNTSVVSTAPSSAQQPKTSQGACAKCCSVS